MERFAFFPEIFLSFLFSRTNYPEIFIGPRCTWGPIYGSRCLRGCANLTDVTLADQATNSMQADNANMAIQGNVAMKVTQSSGQLWNQCKRRHPLTKS